VFLVWHHIYAACIVAAFLNALGPVLLYLAGRLSVGRLPAAIAALLMALSPFFVGVFPGGFDSDETGNSLLTDSPAFTLVLLAFWLLLRALSRQSTPRFAWAGLVLALSILMRFGTLPSVGMLLLLPLAALALLCAVPRKSFRPAGALLVAAFLVFAFLPLRERFRRPLINPDTPEEVIASQFLQSDLPSGTDLYMNFNYPAFAFYTSYRIHELPAVGPARYNDIEQIPPGGVLISYRKTDEVWEPDIKWVNANPKFQRMRDFSTFVIYRRLAEAKR
jgi:dolichyl-phosphate-mannose--protein O-mannosyl transferase